MDIESEIKKSVGPTWGIERLAGSKKSNRYLRLKSVLCNVNSYLHRERLLNYSEIRNHGKSSLFNKGREGSVPAFYPETSK